MAAVSFAILGKNNEPLCIKEFLDEDYPGNARVSEEELFGLPKSASQDRRVLDDDDLRTSSLRSVEDGRGPRGTNEGASVARSIDCSLRQQFILHAALDRFEQLSGPPPGCAWRAPGVVGTDAMFVGLLAPVEELRVYGYMTTTQIRFLLAIEDHMTVGVGGDQRSVDEAIKRLFVKLHRLYVEYMLNPFCSLTGPITSSQFDRKVNECVTAFNRSIA